MIDRIREKAFRDGLPAPDASWMLWWLAPLLALTFFAAEHDLRLIGRQIGGVEESLVVDDYLSDAEGGNRRRQVGYISFAMLGGILLCLDGRPWRIQWGPALLIVAALGWCLATATWSINPPQTLRRLVVVACCLLGAVGLARRLTALELCRLVVLVALPLATVSLALELVAGVRPWQSGARFGGTLHPNITACYACFACMAAYCLSKPSRHKWVWWTMMAICVAFILLTKSRTALGSLAIAFGIFWLASRDTMIRWWTISMVVTLLAGLLFVLGAADVGVRDRVYDTFLLGRRAEASSLTGRIPLWEELWEYAEDRPWRGYGYESFWAPEQIEDVFESQRWAISSAHSAYLELTLGTGLVGATLVSLVALWGTWLAYRRFQSTRNVGYGFVFAALVFGLTNGLLESLFVEPRLPTVVAACGLLMVTLFTLHPREQPVGTSTLPFAAPNWLRRPQLAHGLRYEHPISQQPWPPRRLR
jgi:O-antigen ligase